MVEFAEVTRRPATGATRSRSGRPGNGSSTARSTSSARRASMPCRSTRSPGRSASASRPSSTGSRRRTTSSTGCSNRSRPQLLVVIDAAVRAASDDPLEKIDARRAAVFRPAVRRPALLGLVREMNRLGPGSRRPAARPDRSADRPRRVVSRRGDGRGSPSSGRPAVSWPPSPTPRSPASPPSPRRLRAVGWVPDAARPAPTPRRDPGRSSARPSNPERVTARIPCSRELLAYPRAQQVHEFNARRRRRCRRRAVRRRGRRSRRAGCGHRRTPGRT